MLHVCVCFCMRHYEKGQSDQARVPTLSSAHVKVLMHLKRLPTRQASPGGRCRRHSSIMPGLLVFLQLFCVIILIGMWVLSGCAASYGEREGARGQG